MTESKRLARFKQQVYDLLPELDLPELLLEIQAITGFADEFGVLGVTGRFPTPRDLPERNNI